MPEREAVFFRTPGEWRAWLEAHAADATELWVGFFKRGAGEAGITWPQAVDQALCFGWIDGRRQSIDPERYRIRFTPRTASSIWSTVNVARVQELAAEGLMQPAGLDAFARRREGRSGIYSHEQAAAPVLDAAQEALFRERPEAWAFLRDAGALLPQGGALVGRQRQATGDARAAPGDADRRLRGGAPARAHAAAGKQRVTDVFRS